MAKAKFIGKVVSQSLFFNEKGDARVEVPSVSIEADQCGFYYIHPIGNEEHTRYWRKGWEELEIKKVADGLYHISLYSVSSPKYNIRSEEAFLVLEMTKEEVCNWHSSDVWFSEELNYFVNRKGKKFIGEGQRKRCIKCQYLQLADATECDRGCKVE